MTFLSCKSVFADTENCVEKNVVDDLSLNVDEISSFNPATEDGHITVTMKNGISHEVICGYEKFLGLVVKYSDLPIVRINCN